MPNLTSNHLLRQGRTRILLLSLAASLSLGGCATNGPVTGSNAGDFGVLGTLAGAGLGYGTAKALGANNNKARNFAVLAAVGGGFAGYQHGKAMDQRQAEEINRRAQEQQMMVERELQLQAQIRYAQVQVQPQPTYQVPQPQPVMQPVAQALEVPIAKYEMVSARGGLTPKAMKSLNYMARTAQQSNADLVVLIPSTEMVYAQAIQGAAPGARIMESREIKNFVLIVQPRNQ